jgi:dTDP-4-dehydrorhamnose 3,5-epimerase
VPQVFEDERGYFMETFRAGSFKDLGLSQSLAQENHSYSRKHFQWDPPIGKLMRVTRGVTFLVAVDVRPGSPTVGKWFGIEVSGENRKLVWAPATFALGFCALSDDIEVQYLCTGVFVRGMNSQ